jgi:acyl-[acyl-carrier-protein]-phospholipid O-acyltransferase/long-chain-fatty-acid--[acyl-carrier-protein] ligase
VREVLGEPALELVAVNMPDEKKGERIVLLVAGDIDPNGVRGAMVDAGVNPLNIPAEVRLVEQVPKLGSGKTDFAGAKRLAAAA